MQSAQRDGGDHQAASGTGTAAGTSRHVGTLLLLLLLLLGEVRVLRAEVDASARAVAQSLCHACATATTKSRRCRLSQDAALAVAHGGGNPAQNGLSTPLLEGLGAAWTAGGLPRLAQQHQLGHHQGQHRKRAAPEDNDGLQDDSAHEKVGRGAEEKEERNHDQRAEEDVVDGRRDQLKKEKERASEEQKTENE